MLTQLVGERTVPDLWHENYWFRRHEVAYRALTARVLAAAASGGPVLEAGCGEGYGTALLARAGLPRVVGLDYDPATLRHAASSYPGTCLLQGNLARLPLAGSSVAAVVCLQVLEHLWTPWEFLAECTRVLRPGGVLLLSTPNRITFSPGLARGAKPPNPYHVQEYDAEELVATVGPQLAVEELLGVVHGPRPAAPPDLVAAPHADPPDFWPADLIELVTSLTAADFALSAVPGPTVPAAGPDVLDLVLVARKPAS